MTRHHPNGVGSDVDKSKFIRHLISLLNPISLAFLCLFATLIYIVFSSRLDTYEQDYLNRFTKIEDEITLLKDELSHVLDNSLVNGQNIRNAINNRDAQISAIVTSFTSRIVDINHEIGDLRVEISSRPGVADSLNAKLNSLQHEIEDLRSLVVAVGSKKH